jgi:hypothetical protein
VRVRKTGTVPRRSFLRCPGHVRRSRSEGLSLVFRCPGAVPPFSAERPTPGARIARRTPTATDGTTDQTTARAARTATCTAIHETAVRTTRKATGTAEWSAILTAAAQATHRATTGTLKHTTGAATRQTIQTAICPASRETAGGAIPTAASRAVWNTTQGTTRGMMEGTFVNPTQDTWNQSVSYTGALTVLYPVSKPEPLTPRGSDHAGQPDSPSSSLAD